VRYAEETIFKKRAGGVAQAVEHLPSKLEVHNLNPVQPNKKKEEET
jgi:hypothetical protein